MLVPPKHQAKDPIYRLMVEVETGTCFLMQRRPVSLAWAGRLKKLLKFAHGGGGSTDVPLDAEGCL